MCLMTQTDSDDTAQPLSTAHARAPADGARALVGEAATSALCCAAAGGGHRRSCARK